MNLTNDSYVILIGTRTFTERYYRDKNGWLKVSARGRTFRMTAEQVLNHVLPALAGIKPNLTVEVEHHDSPSKNALQAAIAKKSANIPAIADRIARHPESLPQVFAGLRADQARVKYGCLKLLRIISENNPTILYPEINRLIRLLDSDNKILQWGAIIIVGNLAAVDSKGKIDRILDRYLQPISGPVMITAANVVGGAAKIARAKPELAGRIARALLQVEAANYQTEECRNVVLGHAVQSLDLFFEHLRNPRPVIDFVKRQLHNRRNAVKQKAARFLRKHKQK